jgi:pimeloyl-ACP methyl ester carboxylesterase
MSHEQSEQLQMEHGAISFAIGGSGPAIVLSHGFGPRCWGWPLKRLEHDCTVVAMGRFEPSKPSSPYTSTIELIRAVTQHLGLSQFTLCPWSMAGSASIAYAAKQPRELEKLILVDVAGLGGPLMYRTKPAEPRQQRFTPEEWAKRRAAGWVHKPGPVRDLVEALDLEGLTRPDGFQRTMHANRQIAHAPPPMELEKIGVPTLVLAGRHSQVMGPDAARTAAERLSAGEVVIFENSAHALALEEPSLFQDVVAEFVTRDRPSG